MTQPPDTDPRTVRASYTQFRLKFPAKAAEHAVAQSLAGRGHRWIIVQDGVVRSLCVNPPSAVDGLGTWWQDCERAAVEQIARQHGGYLGGGTEGSGADPEQRFLRGGRLPTIELDEQTALDRRGAAISAYPTLQPEPPAAPPFPMPEPQPLADFPGTIRGISQQVYGDRQTAFRLAAHHDDTHGPEQFGSPGEFFSALHQAVLHQDSCNQGTAEAVPLIVALAQSEDLACGDRAYAWALLFDGASNGLRMMVLFADQLVSQGKELFEYENGRLTREAVQAHADALFGRWDREPQDVQMILAGLAAVFPQQATAAGVLPKLAALAERWPGTRRAVGLRLAQAAACGDDAATLAEIAAIQAWHWQGPLAGGSPLAPPQTRALHLLHDELLYE